MANNTMNFGVDLLPTTTNTFSLGSSDKKWNLYVDKINGDTPKLTGDVTGSASSTGGWSIATTIGPGKVTNDKLANSKITIAGQEVPLGGSLDLSALAHTLSIAEASGTSSISLVANKKYTLTAGGSTYVFTTPSNPEAEKGISLSNNKYGHSNTIDAQTTQALYPIKIDAYGHITSYGNAIVPLTAASTLNATKLSGTIPTSSYTNSRDPGYGKITPANNASIDTALSGNTSAVEASSYSENLKFTAANKWVVLAGTNSGTAGNDELKIAHFVPTSITNTGPTANQTPSYGSTFDIPVIAIDAAGHVTKINTTTVTIPASDNTNAETQLYVNATAGGAYSNAATTNTSTYVHLYDKLGSTYTKRNTLQLTGSGATTVTANNNGVITINSTDADTKNTAGSTNSTSKLYLIGATTQDANPTTNSYQYTYTNNGLLSAPKVGLNLNGTEKAHMEWNNTDQSIDFIFA